MNGDTAFALAQSQEFDLVILDLHLPGMGGAEIAQRLRHTGNGRQTVPIIALTADAFAGDHLGKEFDACLIKPLDEDRLWRTIRRLCRRERVPGAITAPHLDEIRDRLRSRLHDAIVDQRRRISSVLASGDFSLLPDLAHELKGLAGYFGLRELSDAVTEFEQILTVAGDATAIVQRLARINAIIEQMDGGIRSPL